MGYRLIIQVCASEGEREEMRGVKEERENRSEGEVESGE